MNFAPYFFKRHCWMMEFLPHTGKGPSLPQLRLKKVSVQLICGYCRRETSCGGRSSTKWRQRHVLVSYTNKNRKIIQVRLKSSLILCILVTLLCSTFIYFLFTAYPAYPTFHHQPALASLDFGMLRERHLSRSSHVLT